MDILNILVMFDHIAKLKISLFRLWKKKKTKKVPQKISMLRHKNEGLSISFLGVFFPTPPLLIPYFYDVIDGLSSSSKKKL